MEKLRIFLADLTYDTITLSTDVFPLNIGYIASYAKTKFNSKIDIKLFKYIHKIENELELNPPDILAMSNYAWCNRISKEISKIFKQLNPNGVVVWGGPNFPLDIKSQEKFFERNFPIDIYVPVEGEVGFSNIIEKAIQVNEKSKLRKTILENPIDGCISRLNNGKLHFSFSSIRTKQLDDIPSPYTSGILDEFFDGKLSPMIQTNRGCPFSCTFCADGSSLVNKVNSFSTSRVRDELQYIAKHVNPGMNSMHISDLNFGMFPKDLEICEYIDEIQKEFNFPKYVKVTSGKNKKEKIIEAIKKLGDSTSMAMSVQSMDPQVLTNIRRDNISSDALVELGPALKNEGLKTASDVILALPGETYSSHLQTIKQLVHADIDWINSWTLMLLDGSELNTPEERKKWNLKSKFRIIPRDFVKLKNGKVVVEIEEVAIGSDTLSFDEYVELRLFALIIKVTKSGTIFAPLFKFLQEENLDTFELMYNMLKQPNIASNELQNLFKEFKENTVNELWNTPEEIENNYQKNEEYEKLLKGQTGQNLVYFYHAMVIADHISDWTEFVLSVVKESLIINKNSDSDFMERFESVSNYCRCLGHNVLGEDRLEVKPEFTSNYDMITWMNTGITSSLKNFKNLSKDRISFELSKEQYDLVEDNLKIYGNTPSGRSQLIKVVPESKIWRTPIKQNHSKS